MKRFFVEDYGVMPNDGQDLVPALQIIMTQARNRQEPCEIVLRPGQYDLFLEELSPRDIYVSNTHSEEESDSHTRNFAILLEALKHVTLNGNGCRLLCHGKMTQLGILNCEDIHICNCTFDMLHPTVTEMTVIDEGVGWLDCQVHPDSLYRITNGKLEWYGENYSFSKGISQLYDPQTGMTWRAYGPMQDQTAVWEELTPGVVRLHYSDSSLRNPYGAKVGQTFQMRDPLRDECGILIDQSSDITLRNVTMCFMHGMGLLAQNSRNLTVDTFVTRPGNGRTNSCFADVMHFSGCRGSILIENGCFVGAHDDALNVHGTYLQIVKKDGRFLTLRFMHPQTFGICGFAIGDEVGAVQSETMLTKAVAVVTNVKELSPRELQVEIEGDTEQLIEGMSVENRSANPSLIVRNNWIERIPTRGILISTRQPVLIENNVFSHVYESGILIGGGDAGEWYESSPVTDVVVRGNSFRESGGPFVSITPHVFNSQKAVNSGIVVEKNEVIFPKTSEASANRLVLGHHTDGLRITGNAVSGGIPANLNELDACSHVQIE